MNLSNLIEDANLVNSMVMPSSKETQFHFTALGSLAASAMWGMGAAIVARIREDGATDQAQLEAFYNNMLERVSFVAELVDRSVLDGIASDVASQMQAQRVDADLHDMMAALGGSIVDSSEQAFFSTLDRNEFSRLLTAALDHAELVGPSVSTSVGAWATAKLVTFVSRQYTRIAEFHRASANFRVAWLRAHGPEIRKQSRAEGKSIGDMTILYVEELLGNIATVLDKLEEEHDSYSEQVDLERELAAYENHPDRQSMAA